MNYLKLIVIGIALSISSILRAQVSVNVTIGSPPEWGPVGYSDVRYYYLPDVEAYYDVESSMFIYFGDGVWIHRAYLPDRYRYYDLYDGYKVVMVDYRGNTPYTHFKEYRVKYKKGYRGQAQKTIGSKPGKGPSKGTGPSKHASPGNSGKQQHKSGDRNNEQKNNNRSAHENKSSKEPHGGGNHGGGSHGGGKKRKRQIEHKTVKKYPIILRSIF